MSGEFRVFWPLRDLHRILWQLSPDLLLLIGAAAGAAVCVAVFEVVAMRRQRTVQR